MSEFAGRIAFVTGAAGGIGAAVVASLEAAGARVIATDVVAGANVLPLDISRSADVDALIDKVEREQGPIDFGVNVAGVLSTTQVTETTDEDWQRVFGVNIHGVFHVSRALARHMKARKRGSLVTVSSNAAGIPRHSMSAYAASKAAATMFTRCLGLELAAFGIRCNIVAPGSTLTPMQTGMWADENGGARVIAGVPEMFKAGIPLGKLALPQDVADAVMFLLSDKAGHITMTDIYVDGGATMRA